MNLSHDRRLRSLRTLLGCGLAALAAAVATTSTASAQRGPVGEVWEVTGRKVSDRGSAAITIGNRGASFSASYGQFGRRYRGQDHGQRRVDRRGCYETRYENVWVPGYEKRVWVPAVYEWRYDPCGRRTRVLVCAGYYRTECVPGRYERRARQVWVPARRGYVDHRHGWRGQRHDRVTHVGRRYR